MDGCAGRGRAWARRLADGPDHAEVADGSGGGLGGIFEDGDGRGSGARGRAWARPRMPAPTMARSVLWGADGIGQG